MLLHSAVIVALTITSANGLAAETKTGELDAFRERVTELFQAAPGTDQLLLEVEGLLPHFGGFYLDERGVAHVLLTESASDQERSLAQELGQLVRATFAGPRFPKIEPADAKTVIEFVDYRFSELATLRDRALDVLAVPGAHTLDADEKLNRVTVLVEKADSIESVKRWWVENRLPVEYLNVDVMEPMRAAATLNDPWLPNAPAGVGINYYDAFGGPHGCTMGPTAIRLFAGAYHNGFVTNSHCTKYTGGVEGTVFSQGLPTDPLIGDEQADPLWNVTPCPAGRICRHSDSAFVTGNPYSGTGVSVGNIARPNNYCSLPTTTCSITIDPSNPRIKISPRVTPVLGAHFEKVGRITGWTYGPVSYTSVNANAAGTNRTLLSEYYVNAAMFEGDSGSPVFTWNGTSQPLGGIMWGGNSSTFVFSYWSDVQDEINNILFYFFP